MPNKIKVCNECFLPKETKHFTRDKRQSDGLQGKCNECRNLHKRSARFEKHEMVVATSRRWAKNNPERKLFQHVKSRAKENNAEFAITLEDITIPEICPLLGIKIFSSKGKPTDNSPSVDRKDSNKGYIKGNVWIISFKANRLKNNGTQQEIELLAKNMKLYGIP